MVFFNFLKRVKGADHEVTVTQTFSDKNPALPYGEASTGTIYSAENWMKMGFGSLATDFCRDSQLRFDTEFQVLKGTKRVSLICRDLTQSQSKLVAQCMMEANTPSRAAGCRGVFKLYEQCIIQTTRTYI